MNPKLDHYHLQDTKLKCQTWQFVSVNVRVEAKLFSACRTFKVNLDHSSLVKFSVTSWLEMLCRKSCLDKANSTVLCRTENSWTNFKLIMNYIYLLETILSYQQISNIFLDDSGLHFAILIVQYRLLPVSKLFLTLM